MTKGDVFFQHRSEQARVEGFGQGLVTFAFEQRELIGADAIRIIGLRLTLGRDLRTIVLGKMHRFLPPFRLCKHSITEKSVSNSRTESHLVSLFKLFS